MKDYQKEILADLKRLETNDLNDPLFLLERIKKYDFGYFYHKKNGIKERFNTDYYEYKSFIEKLYATYIELYFEEIANSNEEMLPIMLAKFAISFTPKKYDLLVRLENDSAIYDDAKEALKTETDYPVNTDAFLALAKCFKIEEEQYKIESFFSRAYKEAKEYAFRTREYDYLGDNLNGDIYLAITKAIILLPPEIREKLSDKVFEAYTFASDRKRSYHVNQTSGYMAIYLTLFSKQIDLDVLGKAITVTGKHYQENKFVLQTRYAKWFMENNQEEALTYFKNSEIDDNMEYIIALLADINCKKALPFLKEALKNTKDDPIRTEVFLEAISRLETQEKSPSPSKRMVWLFESTSPTERALGAETDSVFVKRAQEKYDVDTNVYETDEE